jgi:hypothetical protein
MRYISAICCVAVAAACHYRPDPVPIAGDRATLARLEGTWVGEYSGHETGRSGSISFIIRAAGDSAYGDVLMFPTHGGASPRPLDPLDAHGAHVRSPKGLRIDFVVASAGEVSGTIEPYLAPDCECRVTTTFTGRIAGDVIDGTFVTRGSGIADQRGRWRLQRE